MPPHRSAYSSLGHGVKPLADEKPNGGEGHNSRKALDFGKAAAIMKSQIAGLNEKAAKTRGDQSAAWAKIEELGLNKKAAKALQGMMSQSPATVSDYLRTFIGLLGPLGLGIIRDMVDVAEDQSGITVPLIDTPSVDA